MTMKQHRCRKLGIPSKIWSVCLHVAIKTLIMRFQFAFIIYNESSYEKSGGKINGYFLQQTLEETYR